MAILDSVSPRELEILVLMSRYEETHPNNGLEADAWNSFLQELAARFRISRAEVVMALWRLTRTGLFVPASTFGANDSAIGQLSPGYAGFRDAIELEVRRDEWVTARAAPDTP
jgi:hypothetical protein